MHSHFLSDLTSIIENGACAYSLEYILHLAICFAVEFCGPYLFVYRGFMGTLLLVGWGLGVLKILSTRRDFDEGSCRSWTLNFNLIVRSCRSLTLKAVFPCRVLCFLDLRSLICLKVIVLWICSYLRVASKLLMHRTASSPILCTPLTHPTMLYNFDGPVIAMAQCHIACKERQRGCTGMCR